jgi:sugar phosphate isomerase/epimerase
MKEYKVLVYQEGMLSSLFLGSGKVDPERFGDFLNEHASQGYRVVTIERESRRMLLFSQREAFLVVLERER